MPFNPIPVVGLMTASLVGAGTLVLVRGNNRDLREGAAHYVSQGDMFAGAHDYSNARPYYESALDCMGNVVGHSLWGRDRKAMGEIRERIERAREMEAACSSQG